MSAKDAIEKVIQDLLRLQDNLMLKGLGDGDMGSEAPEAPCPACGQHECECG